MAVSTGPGVDEDVAVEIPPMLPAPAPNSRYSQLSEAEKISIIYMHGQGHSNVQIGAAMGRSDKAVGRVLKKWFEEDSVERTKGSGRKRKTSAADDRAIVREVRKDRFISCADIVLQEPFTHLSISTISRRIRECGEFSSFWAAHKPFISEANRRKRVGWCSARVNWTVDQWRKVLWTDESPFVLRFNRKKRVWRHANERYKVNCMTGSVKHDKKIMVWGCFAAHGVGSLIMVDGIMEQVQFRDILSTYMLPSAENLFGMGEWIYQQDNDPKHTAIMTQNWFIEKACPIMEWPSQSPDLNPIENLWTILDNKCQNRNPQNEAELLEMLQTAWYDLAPEILDKLVCSMPRRCAAVIENDGYPCKY